MPFASSDHTNVEAPLCVVGRISVVLLESVQWIQCRYEDSLVRVSTELTVERNFT